MRRALLTISALLAAGGTSCLLDIPDVVSGGDGATPEAGAQDAPLDVTPPSTCSGSLACVTAAPSGWTGPFAFAAVSSGTAVACPSGLTQVLAAHEGLNVVPATCATCNCNITASYCQTTVTLYTDTVCGNGQQVGPVSPSCGADTLASTGSLMATLPVNLRMVFCTVGTGV